MNLAREARRFKDYPGMARVLGWEGVAVVVVNTGAGVAVPVVSLSQSSGFDALDQAALDLVGQAVGTAALPENLRGRQFALTLPIHYRLDE
jgi:protein TonB